MKYGGFCNDCRRLGVIKRFPIQVLYAAQRHTHMLPDGNRAGFFIGDGAGVGKVGRNGN